MVLSGGLDAAQTPDTRVNTLRDNEDLNKQQLCHRYCLREIIR